jgi:imidazolonepropionase-like amidohydrolase
MVLARVFVLLLGLPSTALAQTVAIRAGNLVDPATGSVAKNQIILVRDGKIAEVGPRVQIPAGVETIDLSSSWVMPGLADAHVHLTAGPAPGLPAAVIAPYLSESSGLRALRGAHHARALLMAGFTAVRDVGNDAEYSAVDLRRAIGRGWTVGPTMLTTGKIIAPFGGQSENVPAEQGRFWKHEYLDADTPDEVRKAVRQNIYYGANAIKLVADHNAYFFSTAEVRAAVEESHAAGLTCAVHVYGGKAADNVIAAQPDSMEHGFTLSDEQLRIMKEKAIVLVGTDFPEAHLKQMAFNPVEDGKTLGQRIADRLRRAHHAGVTMAFGTDVFMDPADKSRPELMLEYLDVWTAAGIPPGDILKAMTVNAYELFKWRGKRGWIAAGHAADIIAAPANPLENIQALRKVNFVMKDGKVVRGPTSSPAGSSPAR